MTWPGPYPGSRGRLGSSESLAARGTGSFEGRSWACVGWQGQGSCWQASRRAVLCLCVRGVPTASPSFSYSYKFSMLVCVGGVQGADKAAARRRRRRALVPHARGGPSPPTHTPLLCLTRADCLTRMTSTCDWAMPPSIKTMKRGAPQKASYSKWGASQRGATRRLLGPRRPKSPLNWCQRRPKSLTRMVKAARLCGRLACVGGSPAWAACLCGRLACVGRRCPLLIRYSIK